MFPIQRFWSYVRQHQLFTDKSKLLLALSGGKDSVLLFHILNACGIDFVVAHCNFQLRGEESDKDEQFVRDLSLRYSKECYVKKFDTISFSKDKKTSIQIAARDLRYEWFVELAKELKCDKIATAHHQTDGIETILFNLTRGTGIEGLHGILATRDNIIRPLMFLSRIEIDELIVQEKLDYREDSSNTKIHYSRNFIRHEVLPKLRELNPDLEQTFENNILQFLEMEHFLTEKVNELRTTILKTEQEGSYSIAISDINALDLKLNVLYRILSQFGFSFAQVKDLCTGRNLHTGAYFYSESYQLLVDRGRFLISRKNEISNESVLLTSECRNVNWGKVNIKISETATTDISIDKEVLTVDEKKLVFPLTLRSWCQADAFQPFGMEGKKKLSDYFQGQKIPDTEKPNIPILVNGDGEVIWVVGYRMDDRFKITSNTKKIRTFDCRKKQCK